MEGANESTELCVTQLSLQAHLSNPQPVNEH